MPYRRRRRRKALRRSPNRRAARTTFPPVSRKVRAMRPRSSSGAEASRRAPLPLVPGAEAGAGTATPGCRRSGLPQGLRAPPVPSDGSTPACCPASTHPFTTPQPLRSIAWRPAHGTRHSAAKMLCQQEDILPPLTQRRNLQDDHRQPMVQILWPVGRQRKLRHRDVVRISAASRGSGAGRHGAV